MQKEFYDLTMATQMISDLGKRSSDMPGLNIKDKMLGKPTDPNAPDYAMAMQKYMAKNEIMSNKLTWVENMKWKIRAIAIQSAAGQTENPMEMLTRLDAIKVTSNFPDGSVESQVRRFAMKKQSDMIKNVRMTEDQLLNNEAVKKYLAEQNIDLSQLSREEQLRRIQDIMND